MPRKQSAKDGRKPLFERGGFEGFVLALPATTLVRQWGDASVAKIGGRIFAIYALGETGAISFKCSELAFEMLPELAGISPAPYLARAKWVEVGPGASLTNAEIGAYIAEAHRLVSARLTRKQRDELGLEHPVVRRGKSSRPRAAPHKS